MFFFYLTKEGIMINLSPLLPRGRICAQFICCLISKTLGREGVPKSKTLAIHARGTKLEFPALHICNPSPIGQRQMDPKKWLVI